MFRALNGSVSAYGGQAILKFIQNRNYERIRADIPSRKN
jgi:hypothetical protein